MDNPAALGVLVPIFAILIIFGAPMAVWIVHRVLAHQERLEMIRNGMVPGSMPPPKAPGPRGSYSGPIPPPMPGVVPFAYDPQEAAQCQLRKGVQVALVGLALLIGLSFIRGPLHPGPWLLGGLIPMFVGIAQIVNAMLNGARLPSNGAQTKSATRFGPAEQQRQASQGYAPPPPPPASESYGGWRPDGTPEIPRPPTPPDARM